MTRSKSTVVEVEVAREPVPVHRTSADLARSGKVTPMLRQYLEAKHGHEDCVLFFRLGDFYECFFEDAVVAADVLGIALTARGKGEDRYAMAGVPHHAAPGYIARLIEAGHKVAIADQVEDAADAKGLVRREVVRVVTPGMVVDDAVLEPGTERLLATVTWSSADGGALALLDVSTGAFRVTRLERDEELLEELLRSAPREVIVADDAPPERTARLFDRLEGATVSKEPAELFHPREGEATLKRHFGVSTLDGYGMPGGQDGSLIAGAAGAALRYAQRTLMRQVGHVDRLRIYHPHDYLVLDDVTRKNLEVLCNLRDGRRAGSLRGLLDRTGTAIGSRRLAQWLQYPLRTLEAIEARQDAVQTLVEQAVLREDVRDRLRRVADVERVVGRLSLGQGTARDLVALERSLSMLPSIRELVLGSSSDGDLLTTLAKGLAGLEPLQEELAGALVDEPPPTVNDGGMIRPGYDADLDALVELCRSGKGFIVALEAREREATGIGSLKVKFNRVFGYYLEVSRANVHRVPAHYERRQTVANAERYVIPELKEYEEQVLTAEERRRALEHQLFERLRIGVAREATALRQVADRLADLDVLAALAHTAAELGWTRPTLDDTTDFEIEEGTHPVVAQALRRAGGEPFVPNDLALSAQEFLLVITGPNMAGKSTAMRQAALIALLAHMGSFVPARRVRLGRVDRIFTRIGASDDLAGGKSTFMVEMTETANILNHATRRSLVILDEIGRGTSTYDGVSIAWAVAEHLHDEVGCRTLFATHYHELTDLAKERAGVRNYTVAVKEWNGSVVFLRKLVPGAANRSYGIQVARLAGLPPGVLDRAGEVLQGLEAAELDELGRPAFAHPAASGDDPGQLALFSRRERSSFERELAELDVDTLTPRAALERVYEWKTQLGDDGDE